eukprot:gnl/TRDRNA2_/TRDRNA2_167482_c0_seq1.p2 gnl/TRDRNA2_/TRDRNA2_167482_c0~~gnl/TRDRNA2_/TRDRNA2_167482_c0_seq1.p2  ORF type:complete len:159 (+),score=17.26 gnl/TRDRNA2_/TRDRNA2_167482_c0_seq1:66-542(+)
MSLDPTSSALEWSLRMVLSAALVIHSILDITDPCTGAKSYALNVEGSLPRWLLPAVGILRAVAAVELFSDNPYAVLGALAYISTLWSGAVYYHTRRKHHPAAVLPACFFVLLAAIVIALRVNLWVALVGTTVCALAAVPLGRMLVTPAPEGKEVPDWI